MRGSNVASERPELVYDGTATSVSSSNPAEDPVKVSADDAATAPEQLAERRTRAARAGTTAARSERNRVHAHSDGAAPVYAHDRLTALPVQPFAQSLTEDEVLLLLREADVNTRSMKALGMITQLPKAYYVTDNGLKYAAAALALLAGRFNRPAGAAKQHNWKAAVQAFGVTSKVEPKNGELWLTRLTQLDVQLADRADAEALKQSATDELDDELGQRDDELATTRTWRAGSRAWTTVSVAASTWAHDLSGPPPTQSRLE